MIFIDRLQELRIVRDCLRSSKQRLYTLLISGNRRIGKTRLILEILRPKDLYFFVNRDKISSQLLKEYQEILREKKILSPLEYLNNWDDFIKILFERIKGIVVFDEFQNFRFVEPAIYGIFQKYIDLNENRKNLLLIFLGSNIGLIKRTFEDRKSPLYGRIRRVLKLKPLCFKDTVRFCEHLNIIDIQDIFVLYSVFGGYPKYYVHIEDEGLKGESSYEIIKRFFFKENALLSDEANFLLSLEFGKRKSVYYEILSALASGNTSLKDIASFLNRRQTSIIRQFTELMRYFELIDYIPQIFRKKQVYFIKHPLIEFWFWLFFKNYSLYLQNPRFLFAEFKKRINTFLGRKFEHLCREVLKEMNAKGRLPFLLEKMGNHIGFIRKIDGRIPYEIDIVGINYREKKVLFCECKWKEKVDCYKVLDNLKKKASLIDWHRDKRKTYFMIFAKSFSKKDKSICIDLQDINRL